MGRLNNRGFAVSTILYGLLLMASLILFLLMGVMSFERKSTDDLQKQIVKELNDCVANKSC